MAVYLKCAPNGKTPVEGPWQLSEEPWPLPFNNGLTLENRTVVDWDSLEPAREFWRSYPQLCSIIVRTRRGVHMHFNGSTRGRKFPSGDLKSGPTQYVLCPPSRISGHSYELIRGTLDETPPEFPEHLFPDVRQEVVSKTIRNVRAYVAKIESIQGQNGSAGLVRAAARCRDNDVPPAEATLILLEWNSGPTVSPPWPAEEIARAITRVYEKGS